jgi:hypothetical protein
VIDFKNGDEKDLVLSQTVKIQPKESQLTCTRRTFKAVMAAIKYHQPTVCVEEQAIYVQNFQTA